jgi:hypothetical protein
VKLKTMCGTAPELDAGSSRLSGSLQLIGQYFAQLDHVREHEQDDHDERHAHQPKNDRHDNTPLSFTSVSAKRPRNRIVPVIKSRFVGARRSTPGAATVAQYKMSPSCPAFEAPPATSTAISVSESGARNN